MIMRFFFLHGTHTASIECANTMLYDLGYGKLILFLVVFAEIRVLKVNNSIHF